MGGDRERRIDQRHEPSDCRADRGARNRSHRNEPRLVEQRASTSACWAAGAGARRSCSEYASATAATRRRAADQADPQRRAPRGHAAALTLAPQVVAEVPRVVVGELDRGAGARRIDLDAVSRCERVQPAPILGVVGFRYRKTVRLSSRTRVNVGSRKASVSVGVPGLTVNLSRRGARATVSPPGTGLSYVTKQVGGGRRRGSLVEELAAVVFIVVLLGTVRLVWNVLCLLAGLFVKQRQRALAAPDNPHEPPQQTGI